MISIFNIKNIGRNIHSLVEFARNKASALNFIDSHANSHILDDISKSIFNDFMDHIRAI